MNASATVYDYDKGKYLSVAGEVSAGKVSVYANAQSVVVVGDPSRVSVWLG